MSDSSQNSNAGATPVAASGRTVDPKLLEILICPLTKTRLEYDPAAQELISKAAGLAFPIKDGVPIMTANAARPLKDLP